MIIVKSHPSSAGCSGAGPTEFLADPAVVVAPVPDPSLIAFLNSLLDGIEKLVLGMPEVWVPFAELFGGLHGNDS